MSYEFSCRDAGHSLCRWHGEANSEDELMAKVTEHVKQKHNVETTTGTIAAFVETKIRKT